MKTAIRITLITILILLGILTVKGQTDTEFWFVAPEITWAHNAPGGVPAYLRFSTIDFPATVTISMPANQFHPIYNPTGFQYITINLQANTTQSVDLSSFIRKYPAVAGEFGEANQLENKVYTSSGINNLGLHITATNVITAFYEVGNISNSEMWALKGKNALGTEFYTPFQNQTANVVYNPTAYSAIDIVATDDNTVVSVTPTQNAAYGIANLPIPAGTTYTVILNRGQTFSVFPAGKGVTAAAHIGGTKVTSSKPIAITLKDDSIKHTTGGCYDVVGDQLVPTSIIGWDYIAIRSQLTTKDHIYITATVDGTNVTVRYGATVLNYTLNAGIQQYVPFPDPQATMRITSDITHPVYVFHIGGFGCEQGGAILPPISTCTGSTQVAFTRANTQTFFINLMVKTGAEASFELDGSAALATALFPPAAFLTVPGPSTTWKAARVGPFTLAQITQAQHLLRNTEDVFHLGIVNGGPATGCMYGYFSDYNELKIDAVVAGTRSSVLNTCYGVPVQLFATGGTNFTWVPETSLSNNMIFNPFANPVVTTQYKVIVEGACEMKDTAFITIAVSTKLEANFSTDKVVGCAPFTVNFKDNSLGVEYWRWDFGDGTAYEIFDTDPSITFPSPPVSGIVSHTFQNNTALPITYRVQLLIRNADRCNAIYEKDISVYPSIDAAFTSITAAGCSPRNVTFTNTSSTNTNDRYLWEFGDGQSEVYTTTTAPAPHQYANTMTVPQVYNMQLIAQSPFGCRDTATQTFNVAPKLDARFVVSTTHGCSPLLVNFTDQSEGDIATWELDHNNDGVYEQTTRGNYPIVYTTNTDKVETLTLRITNSNGCVETKQQTITIYPELQVNIGSDRTICQGETVTLDAGIDNISYNWSTGATTKTIATKNSGNYQVTVTDFNGCSASDDASVTVNQVPVVNLGGTQSICQNEILILDAGNPGSSYLWSTGEAGQTITVTQTGIFLVRVTNEHTCTATGEANVTIRPLPVVNIGADTINVGTFPYQITPQHADAGWYLWSNGSTNLNSTVYSAGTYTLKTTNNYGCSNIDSVTIRSTTGIVDLSKTVQISVFPNPAHNELNVYVSSPNQQTYTIELQTIHGRIIKQIDTEPTLTHLQKFDVGDMAPGMYIVRIATKESHKVIKVVIY